MSHVQVLKRRMGRACWSLWHAVMNTCDSFVSLCGEMETVLCLSGPEVASAEAHCLLYFHKSESRADQTPAGGMAPLFPCHALSLSLISSTAMPDATGRAWTPLHHRGMRLLRLPDSHHGLGDKQQTLCQSQTSLLCLRTCAACCHLTLCVSPPNSCVGILTPQGHGITRPWVGTPPEGDEWLRKEVPKGSAAHSLCDDTMRSLEKGPHPSMLVPQSHFQPPEQWEIISYCL